MMKTRTNILAAFLLCGLALYFALQINRRDMEDGQDGTIARQNPDSTPGSLVDQSEPTILWKSSGRSRVNRRPDKVKPAAFLRMLLSTVLANTIKDLPAEELDALNRYGESEIYQITKYGRGGLEIIIKPQPEIVMRLHTFPMGDKTVVVLGETSAGKPGPVSTFIYDEREKSLTAESLLPKISINEFYADEDKVPERESDSARNWLDGNGKINYYPNVWMDKDFGDKKVAFDIEAVWDGERFVLEKTKVK